MLRNFSIPLCLVALTFILPACADPRPDPADPSLSGKVNPTYVPPQFNQEERALRISRALDQAHRFYQDCADQHHLPGLVYGLVVGDSLVFSGGVGTINLESQEPATEQSLFRIASMTKSFTAMAILKLRDEGKLSLLDPASLYLPVLSGLEYPTRDATPVTLFQLLTMTAGFPEDNPWGDRFLDISPEDLMEQVSEGIPFSTVPSLHYEYSNLGYGLLGEIISRVSGMPFQEYISKYILKPLEMKHTLWEYAEAPEKLLALGYRWENNQYMAQPLLHDGAFGAMGGLITSIEDFSKYVSLHLSAWPPRNDPETGPVKRSTLREMHRMNNPGFYADPERFEGSSRSIILGYGLGLRVMKDEQGVVEVGHNGGLPGFGSSWMFYPEYGIGIMAFGNVTYTGGLVKSVNYRVVGSLMDQGLFEARSLSVSPILVQRKEQLAELLMHWDPELEQKIVAANLYLDIPQEVRMAEARDLLNRAGEIIEVGPVDPDNQLRGSFLMKGNKGQVKVYFTLSPEVEPRVQWIGLDFIPAEP